MSYKQGIIEKVTFLFDQDDNMRLEIGVGSIADYLQKQFDVTVYAIEGGCLFHVRKKK